MAATSTPSHHNNSSSYDCHILSFVDVEEEDYIEHVSDKEEDEGMEDDRSSAHPFVDIDMCEQFLVILPSMHKNFNFQIFHNASINSFLKPT